MCSLATTNLLKLTLGLETIGPLWLVISGSIRQFFIEKKSYFIFQEGLRLIAH